MAIKDSNGTVQGYQLFPIPQVGEKSESQGRIDPAQARHSDQEYPHGRGDDENIEGNSGKIKGLVFKACC